MKEKIPLKAQEGIEQTITGHVVDEAGELNGVEVSLIIPGCEKQLQTKTKKGHYEINVPTKPDFGPYTASVTYAKDGYTKMTSLV